jgi:hypothetical protein
LALQQQVQAVVARNPSTCLITPLGNYKGGELFVKEKSLLKALQRRGRVQLDGKRLLEQSERQAR